MAYGPVITRQRNAAREAFKAARNNHRVRGITLTVKEAKALQVQMIEAEFFGQSIQDQIWSFVSEADRERDYARHVARKVRM